MTTNAGLIVGCCTNIATQGENNHIVVGNITSANRDSVATITLLATRNSQKVEFDNGPSVFNKGITLLSSGGVHVKQSATFLASDTVMTISGYPR